MKTFAGRFLIFAASLGTSASGATVYLSGNGSSDYGSIALPAALTAGYTATASTVQTSAGSTPPGGGYGPNRDSSASYSAYLSLGDLGLVGNVSAFNNNVPYSGTESAGMQLTAGMTDTLTFTGISSGFVGLNYSFDGTLTYGGGANTGGADGILAEYLLGSSEGGLGNSVVAVGDVANDATSTSGTQLGYGSTMNLVFTPDPNNAGEWDYSATGTAMIPFESGALYLQSFIYVSGSCDSDYGSCASSANFLHTALIGDATIYNSSGNPVPGATFVSQSGYDYTQPLQQTNTPEPSTFVLVAIALLGIATRFQRLRRFTFSRC